MKVENSKAVLEYNAREADMRKKRIRLETMAKVHKSILTRTIQRIGDCVPIAFTVGTIHDAVIRNVFCKERAGWMVEVLVVEWATVIIEPVSNITHLDGSSYESIKKMQEDLNKSCNEEPVSLKIDVQDGSDYHLSPKELGIS